MPPPPPPPPPPTTFTITAPPTTDIWRAPPHTHRFTAPRAHPCRGALHRLSRAALTVTLTPTLPPPPQRDLIQYDQGGLLLSIARPGDADTNENAAPRRWLKAGIEVYAGEPWLTVVGCDRWSDASMVPLSWGCTAAAASASPSPLPTARVEVERAGASLWVYWVVGGGRRRVPVREVNWFFSAQDQDQEGEERGEGWEVSVSAYAARPLRKEGEEEGEEALEVEFERFEVGWK